MYFDTLIKSECSGCTACMNACPTSAIRMVEDAEGFLYPVIEDTKCINCGLCRRVCSWEHPTYDNNESPLTLASVLMDKDERQKSTSGGVFFVIAKWIIEQGGIVYGAAFDDNLQLHHYGAETHNELQRLRGSKYIQSDIGAVFKDVKKQLDANRWCYFTGTGCEVAGLKSFLRKNYPKLITSDLVCHGTPSQKLFNMHIKYMEKKYHDKVVDYKFRDYKFGGVCEACSFANRKRVIKPSYELSPYLYSFMHGYTYRQSCYECRFAKLPRQGDITLADFWGIQSFFPDFDNSNGVSLILVNSDKGREIWDKVSNETIFEVSRIEDASKYNGNVIKPSQKPAVRDVIFNEIEKRGYADVASHEFRTKNYVRLRIIYGVLGIPIVRWLYERTHSK